MRFYHIPVVKSQTTMSVIDDDLSWQLYTPCGPSRGRGLRKLSGMDTADGAAISAMGLQSRGPFAQSTNPPFAN